MAEGHVLARGVGDLVGRLGVREFHLRRWAGVAAPAAFATAKGGGSRAQQRLASGRVYSVGLHLYQGRVALVPNARDPSATLELPVRRYLVQKFDALMLRMEVGCGPMKVSRGPNAVLTAALFR